MQKPELLQRFDDGAVSYDDAVNGFMKKLDNVESSSGMLGKQYDALKQLDIRIPKKELQNILDDFKVSDITKIAPSQRARAQ